MGILHIKKMKWHCKQIFFHIFWYVLDIKRFGTQMASIKFWVLLAFLQKLKEVLGDFCDAYDREWWNIKNDLQVHSLVKCSLNIFKLKFLSWYEHNYYLYDTAQLVAHIDSTVYEF